MAGHHGQGGRRRQPLKIAEMKGTARKRKHRDGDTVEVDVPGSYPRCPIDLSDVAKTEWKRIAKILGSVGGMIKCTDRVALTSYCHAWAQFWELDAIVTSEGQILEDKGGKHYRNPAAVALSDARMALLRFSQELGFTPAARSRVRVPEKKASGGTDYKGHAG